MATMAFFAGVFVIGLPTHPVIANFTDYYQRAAEIENAIERNKRRAVRPYISSVESTYAKQVPLIFGWFVGITGDYGYRYR